MKSTTQNIFNALTNGVMVENFKLLKESNPTFIYQETSLNEASDVFEKITELILSTAENKLFDTISFPKRNQIWSAINTINQQLNQAKQWQFNPTNANVKNITNSIIQQTNNLIDFIETSNLFSKRIGLENYNEEAKKLSDIKKEYNKVLKEINAVKELKRSIEELNSLSNDLKGQIETYKVNSEGDSGRVSELKVKSNQIYEDIIKISELIKSNESDVEAKKLGINTFFQNIDEYKTSINELTEKAKEIISKKDTIDNLIKSAEQALMLKSSEGISAAFSAQYETAKNGGVLKIWKLRINLWILFSAIFLLIAVGLTVWIAFGNYSNIAEGSGKNANMLSLIVARVIAVAISITGATFCAKQYIKRQNIAEDYAYKAVLSKSIIAFTDEIKNKDAERVPEYLIKVLDEIHKDPLRVRENSKSEESVAITPSEIVNKVIQKFIDS